MASPLLSSPSLKPGLNRLSSLSNLSNLRDSTNSVLISQQLSNYKKIRESICRIQLCEDEESRNSQMLDIIQELDVNIFEYEQLQSEMYFDLEHVDADVKEFLNSTYLSTRENITLEEPIM